KEYRISNFLLWQISYTELFFLPVFWPDFDKEYLWQVIGEFQSRERRYGKIGEQNLK
ncbi:MAG: undecaprenyl diphosphate synthase family protein, partial [Bacteroidales bacterium]|nr:undecaprenyl diphosphate synthase family protein [Bacteroidales bacterium]